MMARDRRLAAALLSLAVSAIAPVASAETQDQAAATFHADVAVGRALREKPKDGNALKRVFAVQERGRAKLTSKLWGGQAAASPGVPSPASSDDALPRRTVPCPPGSQPDEEGDCAQRTSYGLAIIVLDGLSLAALLGGLAAKSGETFVIGYLGFQLGAPIVHWSHGHAGRGFASFGFRAAVAIGSVPALLFAPRLVAGVSIGAVAVGFLLDYLIIPHEQLVKVAGPQAMSRPTFAFAPVPGGATGSVRFTF